MSKAILVIDMPKSCEDCPLCYDEINCALKGWVVFNDSGQIDRNKKCPLIPVDDWLTIYDLITDISKNEKSNYLEQEL